MAERIAYFLETGEVKKAAAKSRKAVTVGNIKNSCKGIIVMRNPI